MGISSRAVDRALMVLSVVWGGGSIVLLALWPAELVPLHLGNAGALVCDGLLSAAFFLQHSLMVRRPFKARLARVVAERHVGAIYSIASGVVLTAVVVLWQRSPTVVVSIQGPLRWVAGVLSAAALGGLAWGVASLRGFDPLALGPIRAHLRGASPREIPFTVRGAYRWVRHPLYASILLLFWAHTTVTLDHLLFDVLWSAWIVVGTVLEERDLVAELGERYVEYRRRVPMLVPWHAPRT